MACVCERAGGGCVCVGGGKREHVKERLDREDPDSVKSMDREDPDRVKSMCKRGPRDRVTSMRKCGSRQCEKPPPPQPLITTPPTPSPM